MLWYSECPVKILFIFNILGDQFDEHCCQLEHEDIKYIMWLIQKKNFHKIDLSIFYLFVFKINYILHYDITYIYLYTVTVTIQLLYS